MSESTASTPTTDAPDPSSDSRSPYSDHVPPPVQLSPVARRPATHHSPRIFTPTSAASPLSSTSRDADRAYLDGAEAELLEEIQLVQNKLTESRHRTALQKNRRLLRRNPSVSDSIMHMRTDSHPRRGLRDARRGNTDLSPRINAHGELPVERSSRSRIISVSFRLPKKEHRESVRQQLFEFGLPPKAIFSLQGESDFPFVWVGAADGQTDVESINFEDVYGEEHRTGWRSVNLPESNVQKRKRSRYVPVALPDEPELLTNYEMFCEETLWPLLHYDYAAFGNVADLDESWNAYRYVNQKFAEAISEIYEDGDLIWVHNYHLMLLPSMLRETLWYGKIGFFLYTPFPSAEIFRILPHRTELLRGVIGADLIGFHSYDYSKQFLASCTRLLGLEGTPSAIEADPRVGRSCELGIYPGGIDVRALKNHVSSKVVKSRVAELRARFEGRKIVVGVDRLDDCFAGLPLKLLAFEQLLTDYPKLVGKVVLIQVAMLPKHSKNGAAYRAQQMQVNEMVGRINSSFGTFPFSPVHYINSELSPTEIHALMCVGHACVVSTVRDGMGLVPHEWTVCQHGGYKGPIVLSEFAGAAHSFATALHVNPWNVDEMAAKIKVALDMADGSRHTRNEAAYRVVTTHTASLWGFNFLEDLEQSDGAQVDTGSIGTPMLDTKSVVRAYLGSSAQPSPVSSSTVLSSMSAGFSATGLSPHIASEKLSNVIIGPFGLSPRVGGLSPEQVGAILAKDGLRSKNNFVSPAETQDPSWVSPDASKQLKKRKMSNLLVLDLDGTLVPFQAIAKLGVPPQQVLDVIQTLVDASPYNFILIVSSRDRETVAQWLGSLNVYLGAEDGAFFRAPGASSWTSLYQDASNHAFLRHHSSSGQFSQTANTSDSNIEGVPEYELSNNTIQIQNGDIRIRSDRADTVNSLSQDNDADKRKKKLSLSTEDGKHRGSVQSIISLNNETGLNSDNVVLEWKSQVLPVMQHFAERTPGVVIEEGDVTLTWHYTDSDTDFGRWQSRDLYKQLETFLLQRFNMELLAEERKRRWVKVRPKGVDKTAAVVKTLEHIRDFPISQQPGAEFCIEDDTVPSIDFVLCIGDDRADEGMFEFFRDEKRLEKLGVHCSSNRIFTCRVGSSTTSATWFLENTQRVTDLLEELGVYQLSQP